MAEEICPDRGYVVVCRECGTTGCAVMRTDKCHPHGHQLRCRVCDAARATARYRGDPEVRARQAANHAAYSPAYRAQNRKRWAIEDPYANPEPKRCGDCGQMKPRKAFSRYAREASGLQPFCKTCHVVRGSIGHGLPEDDKQAARDWARKLKIFRSCVYCGLTDTSIHIDHYMPRALNGTDHAWNLVPACPDCNMAKRDMHPADWLRLRGLLYCDIMKRIKAIGSE